MIFCLYPTRGPGGKQASLFTDAIAAIRIIPIKKAAQAAWKLRTSHKKINMP